MDPDRLCPASRGDRADDNRPFPALSLPRLAARCPNVARLHYSSGPHSGTLGVIDRGSHCLQNHVTVPSFPSWRLYLLLVLKWGPLLSWSFKWQRAFVDHCLCPESCRDSLFLENASMVTSFFFWKYLILFFLHPL